MSEEKNTKEGFYVDEKFGIYRCACGKLVDVTFSDVKICFDCTKVLK